MFPKKLHKTLFTMVMLVLLSTGLLILSLQTNQHALANSSRMAASHGKTSLVANSLQQTITQTITYTTFLPNVLSDYPHIPTFGTESAAPMLPASTLVSRATGLGAGIVRLNGRISWRDLQPTEGAPIQFGLLWQFESELRALKAAGVTPEVIVDDYPHWATDNTVRNDGKPTSCGRLLPDKYDDFAAFVRSLVAHFKTDEFNVHIWELGNEPDVDPNLVYVDSWYGCWGDIKDPYYGGGAYGEMIKVVSAAIKAEDPSAKVWIGGLLLATPNTTEPDRGKPELFLKGILNAGAAPYFDVIPFHWYPTFWSQEVVDYDTTSGSAWDTWGGGTVGKARYLRQVMQEYGVQKPLFLNETALACPYDWPIVDLCKPPLSVDNPFFDFQANYLLRSFVRGLGEGISGFTWYTLDGPGWRSTGLLDGVYTPQLSYKVYQQLITRLGSSKFVSKVDYGNEIEAYAFRKGNHIIQMIWAKEKQSLTVNVPHAQFFAAFNRDGMAITPTLVGTEDQLPIGPSPIYVELVLP